MTITIKDSTVTSGAAGVAFDNDGGKLMLENVEMSDVTSASIIATANSGSSFLQDSKISASSVSSVTFTTAGGSQTVMKAEVSAMNMVEDVFYVEGSDSVLALSETTITRNTIEAPARWTAIAVQSQAVGTILDSTISDNTGLEFGVSSTLAGSVVLQDSNIRNNEGVDALNFTSSVIFGISDSSVFLQDTKFNDNSGFTVCSICVGFEVVGFTF